MADYYNPSDHFPESLVVPVRDAIDNALEYGATLEAAGDAIVTVLRALDQAGYAVTKQVSGWDNGDSYALTWADQLKGSTDIDDRYGDFPWDVRIMSEVRRNPMTDNETPRVGDTVHVEYDTTVKADGYIPGTDGWCKMGPEFFDNWHITVIRRADSPANDPIGTVATLASDVWVKRATIWSCVTSDHVGRYNGDMTGRVVTGAVPGTPAAEAVAKQVQYDADTYGEDDPERNPRTISYGDPKPDRDTVWRDVEGDVWAWDRTKACWCYGSQERKWPGLPRHWFPMTEVIYWAADDDAASDERD